MNGNDPYRENPYAPPRQNPDEEDLLILTEEIPPEASPPPPAPRPAPRLSYFPLLLFLATCFSTLYVGGWEYAVPLMTILVCHEAGHYIQTRRYRVAASLPYFIPIPLPPFGTFGAVIGMNSRVWNRRALFDIGISGPLAGLVPTLIFCVLGLHWSTVGPSTTDPHVQQLGEPLLFKLLGQLTFGHLPQGQDIYLHPVAYAGWVGLFITALNLVPISQLDGGHILYALLRRRAHQVATLLLIGALVSVPLFGYWQYSAMLLLLLVIGPRHPPTADDDVSLGAGRVILGWLTLAFLVVGFTPEPLKSPVVSAILSQTLGFPFS